MAARSFKCPMCDSTTYAVVQVKKPDGHYRDTPLFKCSRCSVIFHDPIAFTRGREAAKDPPRIVNRPGGRIRDDG
ncbi:MAG TPA: hypothetical protein VED01_18160 [Burkholderiales bacterium]|nr:hypothetical protein [Burkholderiales bacterium]